METHITEFDNVRQQSSLSTQPCSQYFLNSKKSSKRRSELLSVSKFIPSDALRPQRIVRTGGALVDAAPGLRIFRLPLRHVAKRRHRVYQHQTLAGAAAQSLELMLFGWRRPTHRVSTTLLGRERENPDAFRMREEEVASRQRAGQVETLRNHAVFDQQEHQHFVNESADGELLRLVDPSHEDAVPRFKMTDERFRLGVFGIQTVDEGVAIGSHAAGLRELHGRLLHRVELAHDVIPLRRVVVDRQFVGEENVDFPNVVSGRVALDAQLEDKTWESGIRKRDSLKKETEREKESR